MYRIEDLNELGNLGGYGERELEGIERFGCMCVYVLGSIEYGLETGLSDSHGAIGRDREVPF